MEEKSGGNVPVTICPPAVAEGVEPAQIGPTEKPKQGSTVDGEDRFAEGEHRTEEEEESEVPEGYQPLHPDLLCPAPADDNDNDSRLHRAYTVTVDGFEEKMKSLDVKLQSRFIEGAVFFLTNSAYQFSAMYVSPLQREELFERVAQVISIRRQALGGSALEDNFHRNFLLNPSEKLAMLELFSEGHLLIMGLMGRPLLSNKTALRNFLFEMEIRMCNLPDSEELVYLDGMAFIINAFLRLANLDELSPVSRERFLGCCLADIYSSAYHRGFKESAEMMKKRDVECRILRLGRAANASAAEGIQTALGTPLSYEESRFVQMETLTAAF